MYKLWKNEGPIIRWAMMKKHKHIWEYSANMGHGYHSYVCSECRKVTLR